MADLRPRAGDRVDRERAQLVLVTALTIGVALVALVLLVNAAIYTENLATRDPDVGDEEVLDYESTMVEAVGGVTDRENGNEYDDYANVSKNVTDGVLTASDHVGRTALEHGRTAALNESTLSLTKGQFIRHDNASRNFTAANGSTDWTLAADVNASRRHVAEIHKGRLVPTNASNASSDGAFHVVLKDRVTDDEWHAYVYENGTTDNVSIAVKPGGVSNAEEVCSVNATSVTVDFTLGTLDGEECPGMRWGESIPNEYDLRYENGDRANGTYEVTVEGTNSSLPLSDDTSPRVSPAVYSVEVEVRYRSPDLTYRRTVRVVRGEPDD